MREDFEAASSSLTEVDPYRRTSRSTGRNADVSSIEFKASRGSSGVDLRWHTKEDFIKISQEQKDELRNWMKTAEGMKQKKLSFKSDRKRGGNPRSVNLIILVVKTGSLNSARL